MIEVLVLKSFKTKGFMQWVVKKTPYPATPETTGFCFKIKELPQDSAFPEKVRVDPGAKLFQRPFEFGKHAGSKTGICSFSLRT